MHTLLSSRHDPQEWVACRCLQHRGLPQACQHAQAHTTSCTLLCALWHRNTPRSHTQCSAHAKSTRTVAEFAFTSMHLKRCAAPAPANDLLTRLVSSSGLGRRNSLLFSDAAHAERMRHGRTWSVRVCSTRVERVRCTCAGLSLLGGSRLSSPSYALAEALARGIDVMKATPGLVWRRS